MSTSGEELQSLYSPGNGRESFPGISSSDDPLILESHKFFNDDPGVSSPASYMDLLGDYYNNVSSSPSSLICDFLISGCNGGSSGGDYDGGGGDGGSSSIPPYLAGSSNFGDDGGLLGYSELPDDLRLATFNSTSDYGVYDEFDQVGSMTSWILAVSLSFLVIVTIVGNVLVCLSVILVRKLRKPQNYLLVSLATSDLFVALFVMPFALVFEFHGTAWPLNKGLCDLWVSADVLCCTASILNLCAISVDRYQAITAPFDYAARSTPRRMIAVIFGVWLGSACVSLPPVLLLGNEHINPEGGSTCSVSQNSWYQIYATMASFYVPLFVMVFVYFKILRVVADKKKEMTWKPPNSNNCVCSSTPLQPQFANSTIPALVKFSPPLQPKLPGQSMTMTTLTHKGSNSTTSSTTTTTSALGGIHKPSIGSVAGEGKRSGENGGLLGRNSITNLPPVNNSASNGASKFLIPSVAIRVKKDRLFSGLKEHKASTTLGIIMSAFIICWLPFFVLALARPISNWDIPRWVSSLFNWLGYANSALNPVIYATLNRDFRLPFKEILCFRCGTLDSLMRKRYYKDQYGDDTENPEFSRNKRSFPMDSEGEVQPTNL